MWKMHSWVMNNGKDHERTWGNPRHLSQFSKKKKKNFSFSFFFLSFFSLSSQMDKSQTEQSKLSFIIQLIWNWLTFCFVKKWKYREGWLWKRKTGRQILIYGVRISGSFALLRSTPLTQKFFTNSGKSFFFYKTTEGERKGNIKGNKKENQGVNTHE